MTNLAPIAETDENRCTAIFDWDPARQRAIRCTLEPHDDEISHVMPDERWEPMTTEEYLALTEERANA